MGAIVVMMYGLTAYPAAQPAPQTHAQHPLPAATPGLAQVGAPAAQLRSAMLPAAQASKLARSALGTYRSLRPANAPFDAPAELSGTIHEHDYAVHEHYVGSEWAGETYDTWDACEPCHEHHSCRCWRCCVRSTCDMVPHAWYYYPDSHGYYYFRPYNYTQVDSQREFIKSVGGDPLSPYADGLFDRIYEEMEGQ